MSIASLTVSAPILCEIGRIAVLQSHIEAQMIILIAELKPDKLEKKLNLRNKHTGKKKPLDDLKAFEIEQLFVSAFAGRTGYATEVQKLKRLLEQYRRERNKYIHSMWGFGKDLCPDGATRVKPAYKSQSQCVQLQSYPVTIEELKATAGMMERLVVLIGNLRVKATGA